MISYTIGLASEKMIRCAEVTYPNPDDANPATRDGLHLREAPVAVRSNDRRNELRDAECAHKSERWTLHEEEPMRTRDEDESLRDDGDLEVDDGMELTVVVVECLDSPARKSDTKLPVKEVRAYNDRNKRNAEGE